MYYNYNMSYLTNIIKLSAMTKRIEGRQTTEVPNAPGVCPRSLLKASYAKRASYIQDAAKVPAPPKMPTVPSPGLTLKKLQKGTTTPGFKPPKASGGMLSGGGGVSTPVSSGSTSKAASLVDYIPPAAVGGVIGDLVANKVMQSQQARPAAAATGAIMLALLTALRRRDYREDTPENIMAKRLGKPVVTPEELAWREREMRLTHGNKRVVPFDPYGGNFYG
jgi:hypothetical protein